MGLSTTYTKTETDFLLQKLKPEDLYNDETLAGDIIKRIDKTSGDNVNYREVTTWFDGSPINDSKVDGFNFIKLNNKYYKRIEPLENESSLYLTKGKRIVKATEKLEYRQKIILSISINSLQSGNLQLFLNNRFTNVEISNSDDVSSIYNKIKDALWYATVTIVNSEIEIMMPENGYFRFDILEKPNGLNYSFNRINENLTTKTLFVEKDYISKNNYTYIITKDVDLQGEVLVLPANSVLQFDGGTIKNGEIKGNNTIIKIDYERDLFENIFFTGIFKPSEQVFQYKTMQDVKDKKSLFPQKTILTKGFHFENDGGGAMYVIDTLKNYKNQDIYFESFYNGSVINGLYVNVIHSPYETESSLFAMLVRLTESLNFAHFGVKYDAKYYDSTTKKWFTNSNKTNYATDNYDVISKIGVQINWFANSRIPRTLILSDVLLFNQTWEIESGKYSLRLTGDGNVIAPNAMTTQFQKPVITSNADLDALIDFKGVAYDIILDNINFFGCDKRIKNGVICRYGGELETLTRIGASHFENAGIIWLGISASYKLDIASFFYNRVGLLITNKNPIDANEIYLTVDRLMSANRISGAHNDSALIEIDEGNSDENYPASINLRDVKCEGNGDAVIKIVSGHVGTHLKIDGIVFYPEFLNLLGKNNLIQIESTCKETPTIEINNYILVKKIGFGCEILDKKNNKNIVFPTNFKNSPKIIYTENANDNFNGLIVFRSGNQIPLGTFKNYGTTAERPTIESNSYKLSVGSCFFDETLSKPIYVKSINPDNSIIWVDANGNNV